MPAPRRRKFWLLLAPLAVVAAMGALWLGWRLLAGPKPEIAPEELAAVGVPHRPTSLAWSADGAYLAAGAWGWGDGLKEQDPSEVYVIDVANGSVAATLGATGAVSGLAFSPDGKWLAVITRQYPTVPGATPAVLVVFDVPAFVEKFRAKSDEADGFLDLAWAGDGKALYAIDSPDAGTQAKRKVRRWSAPAFAEGPAITSPQIYRYEAIAVSPDGGTLAVADVGQGASGKTHLVRLFDLPKGTERAASGASPVSGSWPRLGFTPDGKAVGAFIDVGVPRLATWDVGRLSWRDAATAKPAEPDSARFAHQPAGLAEASRIAVSPDGTWQACGEAVRRGFSDLGWGDGNNPCFGTFVHLTQGATGKVQTWRVGKIGEQGGDPPALAFSPDGATLAVAAQRAGGAAVLIWAVPK